MSLFGGIRNIHQGVKFVNVIGSAKDIEVTEKDAGLSDSTRRMSWFDLWGRTTGLGTNHITCMACGINRATLGGHIVLRGSGSTDAPRNRRDLIGSNRVFIAPICPVCNGRNYNKFHKELIFQAKYEGKVVHLWGFFEDSILPFSMYSEEAFDSDLVLEEEMTEYENALSLRKETEAAPNLIDVLLLISSPLASPSAYASPARPARIRRSAWSSLYHYY